MYIRPIAAENTTSEIAGNQFTATQVSNRSLDNITTLLSPSETHGTNDYFLKIDGIPGESKEKGHEDEIELESFSWGVSQQGTSRGGGGKAGKATFDDFNFTTRVSKASPLLFQHTASGKHIKSVMFTARKKGEDPKEYYIIKLSDAFITFYQSAGNNGERPVDMVSLTYGKIEIEYREEKADGSLGSPVKAGWDIKANKPLQSSSASTTVDHLPNTGKNYSASLKSSMVSTNRNFYLSSFVTCFS